MRGDKRTVQVNVMMTPAEHEWLLFLAASYGLGVSATVRLLFMQAITAPKEVAPEQSPEAVEMVTGTGSDTAPYDGMDTSPASTV